MAKKVDGHKVKIWATERSGNFFKKNSRTEGKITVG